MPPRQLWTGKSLGMDPLVVLGPVCGMGTWWESFCVQQFALDLGGSQFGTDSAVVDPASLSPFAWAGLELGQGEEAEDVGVPAQPVDDGPDALWAQ